VASGTILECSSEELERSLDVKLMGAFYMTRAFLPAMCTRGVGSIINIASRAAKVPPLFNGAYAVAKAGVVMMTKVMARELAGSGIRVNAVCPGAIQTPGLESRIAASEDPGATRAAFVARHKMGRIGTVEEVAAACLYLASAESSFVTGQMLVLDGGMTL
jgi:2-keto-3-deoxy-L-fuconate dehydrogenase